MTPRVTTTADVRGALLRGEEIALLDVRDEADFAEAHPLFAASLPAGRLELEIGERVPRAATPVVVYDSGEGLAEYACERLEQLGYSDVSTLDGGLDGWRQSGGELFRDVNVPSKAFGELVEAMRSTPSIAATDLNRLLAERADVAVLDARRTEEYRVMSIPTAWSVPGGELLYRVGAAAPNPSTLVVVNCAGRTRSIIGAQTLVNAGIPNRVAALRNGTIGWTLDGFTLQHGADRMPPPVSMDQQAEARTRARRVADRAGVGRTDAVQYAAWIAANDRTTYAFDVRTPGEHAAGHPPGFRSAPGGQLVQETDVFAPVRGARIVLWDDVGVRADMTASWLVQMGWDVSVLDGDATTLSILVPPKPLTVAAPPVEAIGPSLLHRWQADASVAILDVAATPEYVCGHVPGAWLLSRTALLAGKVRLPGVRRLVVTSSDGRLATLAALDVRRQSGGEVFALAGGTQAWLDTGSPRETGLSRTFGEPRDVYKRPYEGTDNSADAMQAYLEWEYGLVAQLARDGTHRFRVLELGP